MRKIFLYAAVALGLGAAPVKAEEPKEILNVSYDIARELYEQVNKAFIADWKAKTGEELTVNQSHAGSSKQARSILEGLEADVVTFNQVTDVQVLHDKGNLIPADWQKRLPNNSSPYYSFPAFLVRAGNPKNIKNWDDLARDDVKVVFPNPKTSGNARYTYLAATAYAKEAFNNDDAKVREFVGKIFKNVPVFDTGGRGATTTFAERGIGDVLVTFEAETRGTQKQLGADKYDVVVPQVSLLAEFPVTVVDKVVDKRGSRKIAEAYLNYLYAPEGQEILAQNFNRVHDKAVIEKHKDIYPDVRLVTVEDVFGGWDKLQKEHFAEGGVLDQLFTKK
ncbi:sulfate transport system substrate-binding protein [Ochrobactrum sp. 19YEA23]|jgi:sulfate transport system substrate-binding protein|uniref:Sulfate ABC transporter substrate-binding protein n=1 Tax=Brucella haematophila TaxID=419474 RepID=A0ABX1DI21_9HYPH|nr:sulfate ABC transporter substrate-binding protein [Brucella haematophila]MBA8818908.1 sulfate transport system substrate-binding protein [Ochrobactrum sp. P6BSIII]MDH7788177.1 sulfate transport system substrate-binding protein [Ochrobactrum sp. 19YEA23]OOL16482.1 thiosulfate transporter subunit [Ochrobactrum sp. P6BS-III]URQ75639.1 MAG: sulfate ABC transporter substrate-binding protein [Candidatus Ochrobactrum gambitense]NKC02622.1 sulfate ABC transporter substrate-binding protein [Brucella